MADAINPNCRVCGGDGFDPDTLTGNCEACDEFEEITSDEVDHFVEKLEALAQTTESENIRVILENAASDIHFLVYDYDEHEEDSP